MTPMPPASTLKRTPFTIGDIDGWLLNDGDFQMEMTRLAKDVPCETLVKALSLPTDASLLPSTFTPVLLRHNDAWVLIDTGVGETDDATRGHLQKHLAALGVNRHDIRNIILTHAHADHFEGLSLKNGAAAFPKARIFIQQTEWDWATSDARLATLDTARAQSVRNNLMRYADQMTFVHGDVALMAGLRVMLTPGHTPGHMVVVADTGAAQLVIAGDLFHHPMHLTQPNWVFVNDALPEQTPISRKRIVDVMKKQHTQLTAYHFVVGLLQITR